jgi:predicted dehydrogenase
MVRLERFVAYSTGGVFRQRSGVVVKQLKVAAIGCGYWGPNLIRNCLEIPEISLEAVVDLDWARLRYVQSRNPSIPLVTDERDRLFGAGIDAVVVSTPPETHYEIVAECLQRGLHVLVEKPLTTNSDEARELITLANERDRILMVGHTFEYNPAVRHLKEAVDSGELGRLHYIDGVRVGLGLFHPRLNVIWDLAPHDFSILIHILGEAPTAVGVTGAACVQDGIEDVAYISLTFPSGILAHMRISWLDPHKTRRMTFVGSKKMIVYDDVEPHEKLRVFDKRVDRIRRTDTFGEFQFSYHYGSIFSPFINFDEPLRLECQHFAECVLQGLQPLTDGYNGLRVVEVIEAAQRSLVSGGVTIPVVSADPQRINDGVEVAS